METEDTPSSAEISEEDRRFSKRQLAQQAIALAVQSRWQEAIDANLQVVEMAPEDSEAFNRLGKAYTEIGKVSEAKQAYENALKADAANLIAQRNLERLSRISEAEVAELSKKAGQKLDPRFFIEETGKTGVLAVEEPAEPAVLATLTSGDEVKLERRKDGRLAVTTEDGTFVGFVLDRLATRLTRLMKTGNEYQAGVVGVDEHALRIIIRETKQSPQNSGKISFPPRTKQDNLPRPYVREGLMRRGGEDEEDDEVEMDAEPDGDDDEEEDASEFGFHEASLEEA
jgi:tetratricopeptide (TPR) repeat protein